MKKQILCLLAATLLSLNNFGQDVDIHVKRMIHSHDPCGINNTVPISIVIANEGTEAAANFKASYRINGQFPVNEMVTLSIPSQDSATCTCRSSNESDPEEIVPGPSSAKISIETLSPGIYLPKLTGSTESSTFRIVKE